MISGFQFSLDNSDTLKNVTAQAPASQLHCLTFEALDMLLALKGPSVSLTRLQDVAEDRGDPHHDSYRRKCRRKQSIPYDQHRPIPL